MKPYLRESGRRKEEAGREEKEERKDSEEGKGRKGRRGETGPRSLEADFGDYCAGIPLFYAQ